MEQRRASVRQRSFIGAKIVFGNRTLTLDCVIRDLTTEGARLVFAERPLVGEHFELHVPKKQWRRPVVVAWRSGCEIGVAFVDQPDAAGKDEAADRLAQLERYNAQLRERIEGWSASA